MKFKNIKKKGNGKDNKPRKETKPVVKKQVQKPKFSPRIYRFITDSHLLNLRWKKRQFWLSVISILALLGFILDCGNIYDYYQLSKKVQAQRSSYKEKLAQWESINREYPGFRDGYLQEAMVAYQLGDNYKAREFTQKALDIDPNFIPSKRLAAYLGMTEIERLQN